MRTINKIYKTVIYKNINQSTQMKLFRYTENYFAFTSIDVNGDYQYEPIILFDYEVIKQTEKSYLIETKEYNGDYPNFTLRKRYILKTSKKKFAEETPELALIGFIKRKEKQLKIFENRVEIIENDKAYAKELLFKTVLYKGEGNIKGVQERLKKEYKKKIEEEKFNEYINYLGGQGNNEINYTCYHTNSTVEEF
jgi:hypothetical protein